MKQIEVVAAIIVYNGKILCVQRNINKYDYISKKFEFPGGKIEAGESRTDALKREIQEELHLQIEGLTPFLTVAYQYPDFYLTMHAFLCTCPNTLVQLTEHIDFKWLRKNELSDLDWAAADVPIVEKLISDL